MIDVAVRRRAREGITLVELTVTLALLGLLAGVVGLALHTAARVPAIDASAIDASAARLLAARDSAVRFGVSVTVALTVDGHAHVATALPDGRVVADSAFAIDGLSGQAEVHAAR